MNKISKQEIKKISLEILTHIDKFCREHNIKYFINYGTLLGAVRHKGFIPWDDDIDISMTRENYDKFIKLYKQNTSKYKIISLEYTENYYNNFIKIEDTETVIKFENTMKTYNSGIFIDIFPIDYFNDYRIIKYSYILESLKFICSGKKEYIIYKNNKLKNIYRLFLWYTLRLINPRVFAILIEKLIKKYQTNNPTFAAFIISSNKDKDILPLNTGEELIELEFENKKFFAPKNYDEILSGIYGEYMTPPPVAEQVDHNFEAYYKN